MPAALGRGGGLLGGSAPFLHSGRCARCGTSSWPWHRTLTRHSKARGVQRACKSVEGGRAPDEPLLWSTGSRERRANYSFQLEGPTHTDPVPADDGIKSFQTHRCCESCLSA